MRRHNDGGQFTALARGSAGAGAQETRRLRNRLDGGGRHEVRTHHGVRQLIPQRGPARGSGPSSYQVHPRPRLPTRPMPATSLWVGSIAALRFSPAAISITQRPGMIANVSLRLLYLIFNRLLGWLLLLRRTSASEDVELVVRGSAPGRQRRRSLDQDPNRRAPEVEHWGHSGACMAHPGVGELAVRTRSITPGSLLLRRASSQPMAAGLDQFGSRGVAEGRVTEVGAGEVGTAEDAAVEICAAQVCHRRRVGVLPCSSSSRVSARINRASSSRTAASPKATSMCCWLAYASAMAR